MTADIPNDIDKAIAYLEQEIQTDIATLESNAPDPLAPLGEQIQFGLQASLVRQRENLSTSFAKHPGGKQQRELRPDELCVALKPVEETWPESPDD